MDFITEDRARVIIMEQFTQWDEKNDARHRSNTKKMDRLTVIVSIGMGIVICLNCLLLSGHLH